MSNINDFYRRNFRIAKSNIHGMGLYPTRHLKQKDIVGVCIYYSMYFVPIVTSDMGKWINHSYSPSTALHYDKERNVYYLYVLRDLGPHEELTANYINTPWFIKKPEPHYK